MCAHEFVRTYDYAQTNQSTVPVSSNESDASPTKAFTTTDSSALLHVQGKTNSCGFLSLQTKVCIRICRKQYKHAYPHIDFKLCIWYTYLCTSGTTATALQTWSPIVCHFATSSVFRGKRNRENGKKIVSWKKRKLYSHTTLSVRVRANT